MQFTKMATNERNTQSLLLRISPRVHSMFVIYHKDNYKRAKYAKFTFARFTASAVYVCEISQRYKYIC